MFAYSFERREADGPRLAGFEDGQVLGRDIHAVGQIVQPHFPLRQNDVEIDDDGHNLNGQFLFLLNFPPFVHDPGDEDYQ